jgi:sulfate adenylyltransferase subunit 1
MGARDGALRLLTAGSVDDGKSTLIGRLLVDGSGVPDDQIAALRERSGQGQVDLSLLTDGLEAEREQGITIDVAYRYFASPRRKFIIADAPGHEQYTRNMVTAAAGSDVAVVLVDATRVDPGASGAGLLPQTRRHALLARLLRVPHMVFAVNKLDALEAAPGGARGAFEAVERLLRAFARDAALPLRAVVPISALRGDNVATRSEPWAWYDGPCLLEVLESLPATRENDGEGLLLPVQYVDRTRHDGAASPRRVLWGRVARGRANVGQRLSIHPGGERASVVAVHAAGLQPASADQRGAGQSVGIELDRHVDVSRGDWMIEVAEGEAAGGPNDGFDAPGADGAAGTGPAPGPWIADRFQATVAWLDPEPALAGRRYLLRHGHRWVAARIVAIHHRLDIGHLRQASAERLEVNEIGGVTVQVQQPLLLSAFAENRTAGAMILVDTASHRTSAALMVDPRSTPPAEH